MASPRLVYFAERAAAQQSRVMPPIPKFYRPAPLAPHSDRDAATGAANAVGYGLAIWLAIALLFLVVVYR